MITEELVDRYASVAGELERLTDATENEKVIWGLLDELLLDLHLIRHGYADEAYARHVERRLRQLSADAGTIEKIKLLRL